MTYSALSLLAVLKLASLVSAQSGASTALTPLASKHFTYPNIPYQVTGDQGGIRGPQSGYNICNSTTENQQSQCQTLFLNSLNDFCMWSSNLDTPTDTIGEGEAREVAWCTQKGHGSRSIPGGAITGVQFLYAKNYLQVVGFIDQTKVNLLASDAGGELDPHGADEQGNPLGGIVFTNGFGMTADKYAQQLQANSTPSTSFTQVIEWINFIGNGIFCLKMCNPADPNAKNLCQHEYDLIGCNYNAIADYGSINGTFQVCDSDDMTPPGVFVTNGVTSTWHQPQTGEVIPPYTTSVPKSSNCHTFSSQQLFSAAPSSSAVPTSSGAAATGSGATNSRGGTSVRSSGATPSQTGTGAAPALLSGTAPLLMAAAITMFSMVATLTV